jgi:Domain of unknown function (DUF1906)
MPAQKLENVVIESAPDDAIGFDVNHPITLDQAIAAFESGFSFCIRYVPRLELSSEPIGDPDITFREANRILESGLAILLVQHVSNPGWEATGSKGMRFGRNAAIYAANCGFPPKVNIFLDLEEVNSASSPNAIADFCNEWFDALIDFGYEPGVYVGSKNGLNADQLFKGTKFKHYWHAASQADPPLPRPEDRGYQMFQPLNLTSTQAERLKNVRLIDKKNRGFNAFEIDLKFDSEIIKDVDLNFTVTDQKGEKIQYIKRHKL